MSAPEQQLTTTDDGFPDDGTPQGLLPLGPAPRELTLDHERYIKKAVPSLTAFWGLLTGMFLVPGLGLFAMAPGPVTFPVLGFAFLGLAIWSGRRAAQKRERLRHVIKDGHFYTADVALAFETSVGRGLARRTRYHVTFQVAGRVASLVTFADSASMLHKGAQETVLWHPDCPEEVVPTVMLYA